MKSPIESSDKVCFLEMYKSTISKEGFINYSYSDIKSKKSSELLHNSKIDNVREPGKSLTCFLLLVSTTSIDLHGFYQQQHVFYCNGD